MQGIEEAIEAAPAGTTAEQLSRLVDLLPCMAFVERGGLIVVQNDIAAARMGWDGTAIAVERVFLGAYPFADSEMCGGAKHFECLLLVDRGSPLVVQGSARTVGDGVRLIIVMEKLGHEDGQGTFLEDLLDSAPEAMAITHDGRLLHVNREFTRLFGYTVADCAGGHIDDLLLPGGRQYENEILQHMLTADGRGSLETVRLTNTGAEVDVSLLVAPVKLSGATMGMFFTFRDIRRQKEQEARLNHNAMHDGLTGLANRGLFMDRLRLTLARLRRRPDRHFAVMFLDLDRFKHVNDTHGHAAGDALLLEVTRRLLECVRPQDTVARFGGDEFAVLLDEVGSRADVACVAERIQTAVQRAIGYRGTELFVSASIGIALVTRGDQETESVVRDADLAMYQAKAAGKARHAFAGTLFERRTGSLTMARLA